MKQKQLFPVNPGKKVFVRQGTQIAKPKYVLLRKNQKNPPKSKGSKYAMM